MSNSFSPKKAPNVFNQETLERLLTALRQPFSIAILASLGLHGVLWAALPNLLAETEKEPDPKQRVQVVELSPAEQSQLPSFGIDPISPTLLPTNPTKPAQSGTKLPDPKLYNDPSLYNFPLPQPPPPDVFPFGLPPNTFNFDQTPARKPPKPSPKPTTPPKPPKDPGTIGKIEKDALKPTVDPNAPVRPEKLSPEQLAALQKDAARSRELRNLYAFNGPTNLAERTEVADQNFSKLKDSVTKLSDGNYKTKYFGTPLGVISKLFPEEACPFVKQETIASIAAIVKPDGKLAESPSVLVPSGFKGLDNAAIDYVEKNYNKTDQKTDNKLQTDGDYQLIRFNFIFDPRSSCSNPSNPV